MRYAGRNEYDNRPDKEVVMSQADIGLVGLAVMGQNLVLNMADHGFTVAVYNRTTQKVDDFVGGAAAGRTINGHRSVESLVADLKKPRRVMLMVRAGEAVDRTIDALLPHLEPGDIIIDGGNSHYPDSDRRAAALGERGIHFIGSGVSGGEEGARFGPSIMPGGDAAAWPAVRPIFQAIAASVDGQPCCDWIGPGGAGHFVKMVHNGIEYGDMQLIAEAYDLLHRGLGLDHDDLHRVFSDWNNGVLDSYLIEITAAIMQAKDEDGAPLLPRILDAAGQKGTGKWTAINALDNGTPLTLITEAVFARALSARKEERLAASTRYDRATPSFSGDREKAVAAVRDALYAAKIISYAQGFMLLRQAATDFDWPLDYGGIARLWRGGCIIRSRFLDNITAAYDKDPALANLLLDEFFKSQIDRALPGWRATSKMAIDAGIPAPAMTSALAFFDGYTSALLPANLLQAQRDFFGAHTYERVDRERGEYFHTDWAQLGGSAVSGTYDA
jgi:6-phosphogluconate dehydrogenase